MVHSLLCADVGDTRLLWSPIRALLGRAPRKGKALTQEDVELELSSLAIESMMSYGSVVGGVLFFDGMSARS